MNADASCHIARLKGGDQSSGYVRAEGRSRLVVEGFRFSGHRTGCRFPETEAVAIGNVKVGVGGLCVGFDDLNVVMVG